MPTTPPRSGVIDSVAPPSAAGTAMTEPADQPIVAGRYRILGLLGVVGHAPSTLELLAIAVDAGLHDLAWMQGCPLLEAARKDPAWAPLEAVVGDRARRVLAAFDAPLTD
jgi:hypothetical protein